MRILLDRIAPDSLRAVAEATLPDWATFVDVARGDPHFDVELGRADVLLHVLDPISAGDVDRAPTLRLIQKFGSGVNTIDLAAARRNQISVTNMPGANAPAVAELTIGLMIAGLRELPTLHAGTIDGSVWLGQRSAPAPGAEIGGRQIGLVGYGAIAQRVEVVAKALGAHVVHHSQRRDRRGWVPLDVLLQHSEIVSLHLPLTDDTAKLLDRGRLSMLQRGALVVNTSRGTLIDHDALIEVLSSGKLRGACLDVFPTEPIPPTHRLLHIGGVVATPHIGWYTDETMARCWNRAIDNCERFRDGRPLMDLVV